MGPRRYEGKGKTVEAARDDALRDVDLVPYEDPRVEVLDQPSKGLLGMGARDARVEVIVDVNKERKAVYLVREILRKLRLECDVEEEDGEDSDRSIVLDIKLEGRMAGEIIGKKGRTLNSLQHLVNLMTNDGGRDDVDLLLDVGEYRERRRTQLEDICRRVARKVEDTQRAVSLDPMPRFERRWVHRFLSTLGGVSSHSEGSEPERYLIVDPMDD